MRILIAEDDAIARRILRAFLRKWGHEPVMASDGNAAWQVLNETNAPHLALLDWMMPGMDGLELCRRLRQRAEGAYVYVILVTANNNREELLQALAEGADDYLSKPWDAAELSARINTGVRITRLQEILIEAKEALRLQATHDSLTGLNNRRQILEILRRELSRCRRQHGSLGVAIADLDHFKKINDSHGHLAGDAVLQEAARRLSASLRSYDAVGRYGGEEFLIVSSSVDALGMLALGERVRAAFEKLPFSFDGKRIRVTLSLGVAIANDAPSLDAGNLLRAADAALYRAKEGGRNRMELATSTELAGAYPAPRFVISPK